LSPVDISQVLTQWGQFILLLMIQLGGLGIIMVTAVFSYAANSRLSLNSMQLGQTTFGTHHAGEIPRFLSRVVYVTLFFESLGVLLLYYSLPEGYPNRLFCAIFHSVSAFCNAGFSIFPNNLQASPFFGGGIVVICLLIMIGGLGFPVLFDIQQVFLQRKVAYERLSPHSKLSLVVTFILFVGGAGLFFLFEITHLSSGLDFFSSLQQSIFYSITARTAGFNMLPVENFHTSAQLFLMLLMLIGASPASTGGGIKTTTVGVLFATVYSTIVNKNQTVVFRREIPYQVVKKSLSIVIIYFLIAGLALTVLTITEQRSSFELGFEVISALSTVGLSLGVTPHLSFLGKLIIMFLMLFGRLGILTIVLVGFSHAKPSRIRYPEDDFYVG
jgi:trk system potassium uptake protein TrkH